MIQRLLRLHSFVKDGLNNGFINGFLIVMIILIGLPAGLERREELAPFAIPIFILLTLVFAVVTVRQFGSRATWGRLIANGVAMAIGTAIVFLLFMSLINRWQARGFEVQDYFAEVTLGTTSRLSGVPESELFPNPEVEPISQEYPEDAELRTDPMILAINNDDIVVFDLGFIKVGGLFGTALVLGVIAVVVVAGYRGWTLIDWQAAQAWFNQRYATAGSKRLLNSQLPMAVHWLRLIMPALLFLLLWSTISMNFDTPFWEDVLGESTIEEMDGGRSSILDLGEQFNMSPRAIQNFQLIMVFTIVVSFLLAGRSLRQREYAALPYLGRVVLALLFPLALLALAVWRIESDEITFISPTLSFAGLDELEAVTASLLVGYGVVIIIAIYVLLSLRDSENLEATLLFASGIPILLTMPLFLDQYQTSVVNLVAIYTILGMGLNIVVGYAGLLDLGHVAFFAVGAYVYAFIESNRQHISAGHANDVLFGLITAAILAPLVIVTATLYWQQYHNRQAIDRASDGGTEYRMARLWRDQPPPLVTLGLLVLAIGVALGGWYLFEQVGLFSGVGRASPFLLALVLGLISAGFAGFLLGFPVLRLRGDYLAIVTLGFGEIISISLENLENLTGGPFGAQNVPKPLPSDATIAEANLTILYLATIGAMAVAFLALRLRHARQGRAWTALRSDEDIAQAMGINLVNAKLTAFTISAAFAGIAGVLFAARQSNLFPTNFSLNISINVLAIVIIGGMGSVPGVVVGSIALVGLPEMLRAIKDYRIMAFGGLLVAMMLVRPGGLLPTPLVSLEERARQLHSRLGKSPPAQENPAASDEDKERADDR
ncbi:MAG: hypothetical protein GYB66_13895 [Chloroflexi bacterium]|nr:hypothetical protein [Chloroflexota bacterium]